MYCAAPDSVMRPALMSCPVFPAVIQLISYLAICVGTDIWPEIMEHMLSEYIQFCFSYNRTSYGPTAKRPVEAETQNI